MKKQLNDKLPDKIEGIFAIYKPIGISSQKAVQEIKWWARKKSGNKKIKVGHAGTLDPLAEGVLVIAIGRQYTKKINDYVNSEKIYNAEITLGKISETDDAEGPFKIINSKIPLLEDIKKVLNSFVGEIEQTPPVYSAIKIKGQEAYKRIRKGENIKMTSRKVFVKKIEFLSYIYPKIDVRIICAKGVYIRSIARDVGSFLGTGAFMSALVREQVGDFTIEESYNIDLFKRNDIDT